MARSSLRSRTTLPALEGSTTQGVLGQRELIVHHRIHKPRTRFERISPRATVVGQHHGNAMAQQRKIMGALRRLHGRKAPPA